MLAERSCIHPFIEQTQKAFQQGVPLREVLKTIKPYQIRINNLVTNVSTEAKIPHAIGMSLVGLGAVVLYEYARTHGAPFPDPKGIITILPVASITEDQRSSPGDIYTEGLKAIQEKQGVSLEEAHRIAQKDLSNVGADEHVEPTRQAYEYLKDQEK